MYQLSNSIYILATFIRVNNFWINFLEILLECARSLNLRALTNSVCSTVIIIENTYGAFA